MSMTCCSWASLEVQLVKIFLQCGRSSFDPWVEKLPQEKGTAARYSILAWIVHEWQSGM